MLTKMEPMRLGKAAKGGTMPSYQEGRSGRWPNSRITTSPWKDILDLQFEEFMAFFFPTAHTQIDWRAGYEFLDKELQKITLDAALGRRMVDKLVRVQLKDGREQWVLVHVEVQMQPAIGFPERMFVYHYRIRDRFGARCRDLRDPSRRRSGLAAQ